MITGRVRLTAVAAMLAVVALSACSSTPATSSGFTPKGQGGSGALLPPDTGTGSMTSGHYLMPPFRKNVHIDMTSWLPGNSSWAAAVEADKDFQLYYLYAEYTSGNDATWRRYAGPNMLGPLSASLTASDVTSQSFIGTIRYFDMRAYQDTVVPKFLDVAMCFDNAQSSNTDASTGKVLKDTTPPDQHYYMMTDQLEKNSAGKWQVVAEYPVDYYPRAKECKP